MALSTGRNLTESERKCKIRSKEFLSNCPNFKVFCADQLVVLFSYTMAEKCDGQLKGMVQDLKEIIDYLNSTNANQQQEDNPVWLARSMRDNLSGSVHL